MNFCKFNCLSIMRFLYNALILIILALAYLNIKI